MKKYLNHWTALLFAIIIVTPFYISDLLSKETKKVEKPLINQNDSLLYPALQKIREHHSGSSGEVSKRINKDEGFQTNLIVDYLSDDEEVFQFEDLDSLGSMIWWIYNSKEKSWRNSFWDTTRTIDETSLFQDSIILEIAKQVPEPPKPNPHQMR